MAEFDLTFGKFSDSQRRLEGFSPLTAKQKADYRALMQQLEDEQRQVEQLNKLKAYAAKTQELSENRAADLAKRAQELDLMGKSAVEAAHLKTLADEEEKAQQRINQALKEGLTLSLAQVQAELNSAKAYADKVNASDDKKRALSRDPMVGTQNAFNGFVDSATNAGQQVQNALSGAFNSATDALVKFCETGKVNFRSLADSIIQGLLKIAAQQAMGGLVSAIGGSLGLGTQGASGGLSGLISSLFTPHATGGGVNAGGMYLVGESGPELLAMGASGTVVPNHQLRQAISGSEVGAGASYMGDINVTVNHNGMSDVSGSNPASSMAAIGSMIGSKVREILITEQRPGGMLAA
jgi:lambda family phage tail tape measure protein